MTYFEYSVLENDKLIANFHNKKDAISFAKTNIRIAPNKTTKVVKNNKYPTVHGYKPEEMWKY